MLAPNTLLNSQKNQPNNVSINQAIGSRRAPCRLRKMAAMAGLNGSELVHLTFKPNPNFRPPNHETRVYEGMQGDILIDRKALRISGFALP